MHNPHYLRMDNKEKVRRCSHSEYLSLSQIRIVRKEKGTKLLILCILYRYVFKLYLWIFMLKC